MIRTGGTVDIPFQERMLHSTLEIFADGRRAGQLELAPPSGGFVELAIDLPPGTRHVRTHGSAPYRVFHWFALQPVLP